MRGMAYNLTVVVPHITVVGIGDYEVLVRDTDNSDTENDGLNEMVSRARIAQCALSAYSTLHRSCDDGATLGGLIAGG
jgi:hypothetical protein